MKVMRTTVATVVAATLSMSAFSVFAAASLTGAGATFPAPVYAKWADTYQKETGSKVNYQGIGSSGGVKQITANTVDFGASDADLIYNRDFDRGNQSLFRDISLYDIAAVFAGRFAFDTDWDVPHLAAVAKGWSGIIS